MWIFADLLQATKWRSANTDISSRRREWTSDRWQLTRQSSAVIELFRDRDESDVLSNHSPAAHTIVQNTYPPSSKSTPAEQFLPCTGAKRIVERGESRHEQSLVWCSVVVTEPEAWPASWRRIRLRPLWAAWAERVCGRAQAAAARVPFVKVRRDGRTDGRTHGTAEAMTAARFSLDHCN